MSREAKRKPSSPKRSAKRSAGVLIRMAPEQREALQTVAAESGMSVQDFVMQHALGDDSRHSEHHTHDPLLDGICNPNTHWVIRPGITASCDVLTQLLQQARDDN